MFLFYIIFPYVFNLFPIVFYKPAQTEPIQNVKDESGFAEDFAHEALLVGFREKICIKYISTTRFAFREGSNIRFCQKDVNMTSLTKPPPTLPKTSGSNSG